MNGLHFILILAALVLPQVGQAKLFSNSYVSFELPPNWTCKQEGYEHVCVSSFSKKTKEAIIILTAKKRGPQDTLVNYESHLKTPRPLKNYKGQPYNSKVKAVRKRKISGVDWVDATQLGSEVQTYYTRYAATAKDSLGIVVSFSAHKDHYSKYSSDFIRAIQSLKVIAPKNLASFGGKASIRKGKNSIFDTSMGDHFPEGMYGDVEAENSRSGGGFLGMLGTRGLIGILLLLITSLGIFIYAKSR